MHAATRALVDIPTKIRGKYIIYSTLSVILTMIAGGLKGCWKHITRAALIIYEGHCRFRQLVEDSCREVYVNLEEEVDIRLATNKRGL